MAPRIEEFAQSANDGYTVAQIAEMEIKILTRLKWQMCPPTLNMWANWYMSQWDLYITTSEYALFHPLILARKAENGENLENRVVFKAPDE